MLGSSHALPKAAVPQLNNLCLFFRRSYLNCLLFALVDPIEQVAFPSTMPTMNIYLSLRCFVSSFRLSWAFLVAGQVVSLILRPVAIFLPLLDLPFLCPWFLIWHSFVEE